MREACRALRGRVLRTEVYADDGSAGGPAPYACTGHRYQVALLQPPSGASYGGFYASELESLGYHYERDAPTRGSRTTSPWRSTTTAPSPNRPASGTRGAPRLSPSRAATLVTYTEHDVVNVTGQPGWYRAGVPSKRASSSSPGSPPRRRSFAPDTLLARHAARRSV